MNGERNGRTERKSRREDDDGDEEGDQRIGLQRSKERSASYDTTDAGKRETHEEPPVSLAEPDDETTGDNSNVSESIPKNVKENT